MTTTTNTPMPPGTSSDRYAVEAALRDAVASHQAGQLQAAESAYRAILQREPQHPKANHNLGALYVQTQQPLAALPFFAAALESDPAHGQYWLSYVDALHQAGRTDEAREVLSLARRSGLQGEDVDALAAILEGGNPPRQGDAPGKEEVDAVISAFTQSRLDEVVTRAQALTRRFPAYGFGWKVLGVAFKQLGRNAEALGPMQKAVELLPGDAEAYSNLGGNLQDLGRHAEAETMLKRAVQIKPDSADAQFNLGVTLQGLGRLGEAEGCYRKALKAKPDFAAAHGSLGAVLQQLGRPEEALVHFRERARLMPGNPVDAHLIASLTGKNTERAPAKYVEDVFDSYAGNFDNHLQQTLHYETPKKLQALISSHAPYAGKWEVLDLGCGTGLAGVEIAPYAQRLVGVDLSSKMLEQAAARKLYQRLEQADLATMMQRESAASYDVIVAADVFVYLGKLDEVVAEARRLLRPGGVFAFSVEDCDAQAATQDYQLKGTGRYGQSVAYLNRLAAANGYRVEVTEAAQLRVDSGKPIVGRLCIWKAPAAAGVVDAGQLLRQAVGNHQAGNLQEAEQLYRQTLQLQPGNPEANHNLGALAVQSGRPADGLPYFAAALESDPARGQFWLSYIDALHQSGQIVAAREVLALARQHGLGGDDVDALEASLNVEPSVAVPFCPVCGSQPAVFQPLPDFYRQNSLQHGFAHFGKGEMISLKQYSCSRCGASDRERIYALWIDRQLEKNALTRSAKVIHFAPEPALSQRLQQIFASYETADFAMEGVHHKVDLQHLPFADESYDFFICSHVLEHVDSDDKALDELYRITSRGGSGILVAPVIVGLDKTVEDPSVKDAAGRWRLFGQDDHVRLYAHDDYVNKIRSHGFRLEELGEAHFGKDVFHSLGLTPTSILYVVSK